MWLRKTLMNFFKMKKISFLLIPFLLLAISCNKESTSITSKISEPVESVTNNNLPTANYSPTTTFSEEEEENYESMVKTAAVGLLELANDSNLRPIINNLIQEQFDGDDNVLLKNLNTALESNGVNLLNEMENSIDLWKTEVENLSFNNSMYHNTEIYDLEERVSQTINGFGYYMDNKFIQIFIPFIDKVDLNSNPVIALGMEDQEYTDGYQLDTNGNLSGMIVGERFARENLVWVISINEVVNNQGELNDPRISNDGFADSGSRAPGDNSLRISSILVTDKKESWISGRGEISIVMGNVERFSCIRNSTRQRLGFIRVGNDDEGETLQVNSSDRVLYETFNPLPFWDDVGWVFFEKDNRDKFAQEITIPCAYGGENPTVTIRSKQTPYGISGYFYLGPRTIFTWHEEGPWTYSGDINTPSGSEITFELIRIE